MLRSWLFGTLIARKAAPFSANPDLDLEIHALAALLHDLAWRHTSPYATFDKRFEVDCANAARSFLIEELGRGGVGAGGKYEGWDLATAEGKRKVQLLWDAIALHTTPSFNQHKEAECGLTFLGILADFVGPNVMGGGVVSKEEYEAIVKEYPTGPEGEKSGMEFKEGVKEIMCGLCREKPAGTWDNWVSEFGKEFVDGYQIPQEARIIGLMMMPISY